MAMCFVTLKGVVTTVDHAVGKPPQTHAFHARKEHREPEELSYQVKLDDVQQLK